MNENYLKTLYILSDKGSLKFDDLRKRMPSDISVRDKKSILSNLIKDKFVNLKNDLYSITDKGKSELDSFRSKSEMKSQSELIAFEKLKYDFKNAKRIFKTYWISFGISIAAFIMALVLSILKILEWLQSPPVK